MTTPVNKFSEQTKSVWRVRRAIEDRQAALNPNAERAEQVAREKAADRENLSFFVGLRNAVIVLLTLAAAVLIAIGAGVLLTHWMLGF